MVEYPMTWNLQRDSVGVCYGLLMKRRNLVLCLAAGVLAAACGSTANNAEISYDRAVDFETDKSYQWVNQPIGDYAPGDFRVQESFLTTIRLYISDSLAAKGYLAGNPPRFLVNYALGDTQDVQIQQGSSGLGAGKYSPFIVTTVTETIVVIDIRDAASDRSVWRGWAPMTQEVGESSLDAAKRTVDTILARFPPG